MPGKELNHGRNHVPVSRLQMGDQAGQGTTSSYCKFVIRQNLHANVQYDGHSTWSFDSPTLILRTEASGRRNDRSPSLACQVSGLCIGVAPACLKL